MPLVLRELEVTRRLAHREQVVTNTPSVALDAEDLNRWFELPKSELPEAFPRFSEDSFEATLPRGGCRGLHARPLHPALESLVDLDLPNGCIF